jgi:hypothetical protein
MGLKLFDSPYYVLTREQPGDILVLRRTETPFPTIETVAQLYDRIADVLLPLHRETRRLLLDLRDSPLRNDDAFEAAASRVRKELFPRFLVAIVIKTATGKLQLSRLMRGDGNAPPVFDDEGAARAHLMRR